MECVQGPRVSIRLRRYKCLLSISDVFGENLVLMEEVLVGFKLKRGGNIESSFYNATNSNI